MDKDLVRYLTDSKKAILSWRAMLMDARKLFKYEDSEWKVITDQIANVDDLLEECWRLLSIYS